MYYSINNGDYEAELGTLEASLVRIVKHINKAHEYPSDFEIKSVEVINESGNPVGVFSEKAIGQLNDFINPLLEISYAN